jgi:hypothetical protein
MRRQTAAVIASRIRKQILSRIRALAWPQRGRIWRQVWSQVASQVWSQVENQVWSQVENQVWSRVWSQVQNPILNQITNGDPK